MKKIYKVVLFVATSVFGLLLLWFGQSSLSQTISPISVDPVDYFEDSQFQQTQRPVFYPVRGDLTNAEMHILDTLSGEERRIIEEAYDPIAIGIVREIREPLHFDLDLIAIPQQGEISVFGGRLSRVNQDTLVFTTYFQSRKANELRVYFSEGYFPQGVQVNIFSGEYYAFHQAELTGELDEYGFYTTSVDAEDLLMQIIIPYSAAREGMKFKITRLTHVDHIYLDEESYRWCTEDANCAYAGGYANIAGLRRATARLSWPVGGGYVGLCSGSLLNDIRSKDYQPYLITANHCFDNQSDASALEARFDYWSTSCNSGVVNPSHIIVNGSNLIVTNTQSDVTFVLLKQKPTGLRTYLGWTPADISNNANLHSTHHPGGTLLKYSRHQNKTSPDWTCTSGTTHYHYTKCLGGRTAGGSSGGPIVNTGNQLVGQLLGKCWSSTGWDHCNYDHYYNVWGKFKSSYNNNNLQYWLNTVLGGAGVAMSTSPSFSYNYGTVNLGASANLLVTVTNTGTRPNYLNLEAGTATISGTHASQFSIIGNTSLYLAPGESGTLTVRFTPASGGVKTAQLNIPHNADNITSPRVISLTGTGGGTAGLWTGTISANWHTPGNWSDNNVPTTTTNVTIQSSAPYQPVISNWAYCRNLFLQTGATLTHTSSYLDVYGTFDPGLGQYTMSGSSSLWFMGNDNANWWGDNQNDTYTTVWISKSTEIATVSMLHNVTCNSSLNISTGRLQLSNYRTLTINSTSNAALAVYDNGTLVLSEGRTVNVAGGIQFSNGSRADITGGTISCGGNFRVNENTLYNIALTDATLIMNGNLNQYIQDLDGGVLQLHNLTVDKPMGAVFIANENLNINGNVLITSGTLSCYDGPTQANTFNIITKGNWTNNNYPDGFEAGNGKVTFNGTGHQYVYSSEDFNILEADMGAALRINNASYTVTCNQYDWTSGGIDVIAGTFTALDLVDNGIYGGYWLNPGGEINIANNDGYVDLNGNLNIFGGTFNVHGGTTASYWPWIANATLNMSGGVLDFKDQGILIYNTGTYSLNDNITGGIIRTSRGFSGNRADFTPAAGTFEFYGSSNYSISQTNGCTLHDVVINKSAKNGDETSTGEPVYDERSGELLSDGGKANTISLGSDFVVTGNLTIEMGSFSLSAYTCDITETTMVFGNLVMTNAANDLTTDWMVWGDGSSANVTAGTFHADTWRFNEGTTAKLGTGNTTYITSTMYFPTSNEAEFGNLVRGPLSRNILDENPAKAYYPVKVMGNLLIKSGANVYYPQSGSPLIVAGNADIESGSVISFSAADFEVGGTLNLAGKLELLFGQSATVQGELTFPASGWLTINNGTFINNYNAASGFTILSGRLTMNAGSVAEFPGRSISIGASFVNEITDGTMRFGRTLTANSAGTFMVDHGNVEFISTNTGHYIQVTNENYVNNLIVNKPGGSLLVHDNLMIKGDLTLEAGIFNSNNKNIQIAGDWMNNAGPSAFAETTSRVIFNGSAVQFCSTEDFYILEVDKSNELLYNISGHNITCQVYDWSSGGVWISPGNFVAYDLADNGLFGTFAIFDGVMEVYQDAGQYVDVNGDIIIGSYGQLNVYGGLGASYWPYSADASITMSGGAILDFKDAGILIFDSSTLTFTENITGGTIRTPGLFLVANSGFTPAGGTIELYGATDANFSHIAGTYFHNLLINKSGGDGSKGEPLVNRNGDVTENTKANLANAASNIQINNNLVVDAGTLHANGNTFTVGGNVDINSGALLTLNSGSSLRMASAKTITVNNGGAIGSIGSPGDVSTITRSSSGFYALNIESGGTIAADHAFFEYMNTSGVNVKSGAVVHPTHSFHNCTFRYGQSGGRLLTINNNQTFEIHNATFPPNIWGGTYNAYKSINAGQVTFVDPAGPFAGSPHEHDPFNRIFWGDEPDAHNVSLPAGWSGLSSYLMPANTDITDIFAPVFSSFITAQTMTEAYYPAGGVNTIGNWASQSAYKVKMNDAVLLPIMGFDETNKIFTLVTGWNLVPVICNTPVSAVSLFTGTNLTVAKDVAGLGVYWPAMNINTLEDLLPGNAYYALLGSPGAVTFPENAKNAWRGYYPEVKHPDHPWNEVSVSSSSHLIAIETSGMNNLQPGDVLGVFSSQGICFGVTEIADITQNAILTAYADDPFTSNKDGLEESEPMSYRLFRPQTAEVFDVEVEYNQQLPHTGFFTSEGMSAIKMVKLSATGIVGAISSTINIYPNPTDGTVWISGISEFKNIELISAVGQSVRSIANNAENAISIDLSDLQPGIYQIKLSNDRLTMIKKLIRN